MREVGSAISIFEAAADEGGLARALGLGGKLHFWGGEAQRALEDLARAADHARNAGDSAQEADSLHYVVCATYFGPCPVAEALARLAEVGVRAAGNRALEVTLLQYEAQLEAMQGSFDQARDRLARVRAIAKDGGLEVPRAAQIAHAVGFVELLAGDTALAERELRAACETLQRVGELSYLASSVPLFVDALIALGRDEEALEVTERWRPDRLTVPEDVDGQAGWRRVRASLLAQRGDVTEAERLVREAAAAVAQTDHFNLTAGVVAELSNVLRLAGRPRESAAAGEEAVRLYELKGNTVAAKRLRSARALVPPQ